MHFTGDATLFVLDNEGILFSESRQELYACNSPATFIWCCLEEGLALQEITVAYASAFRMPQREAEKLVTDTLNQWQGLGYITGLDIPAGSEIDLTTALGRLLTNPPLRKEFEKSPYETARQLSLRQADREAFVALSPQALEMQAKTLQDRKLAQRQGLSAKGYENVVLSCLDRHANLLQGAAAARIRQLSSPSRKRYYRLLTTIFCIRFATCAQEEMVHPVLAHLEIEEPAEIDVMLDLLQVAEGHLVLDDFVPVGHCAGLEQLAPIVKAAVKYMATNRYPYFLQIHAAVLYNGEKCILLPGGPGNGKTTLTAALACSGLQYFSDEIALLEEESMQVRPVPISLTVKPEAVDLLSPFYPELRHLPVHCREDQEIVRYLAPVSCAVSSSERTYSIGWVVFPRYSPDAETRLHPLSRASALQRIMWECLVLPEPLNKRKVQSLVQWMREVECFDLPMSSLADAVQLVKGLCL